MKRVISFVGLALLAFTSGAAAQTSTPTLPNMFPTLEACQRALASGMLRFYEPKYFGLRTRDPINGVDRIAVPLESDTCLEMLVVGGRRFVAQREGTVFRARKLADGSLSLYARDNCGNPVYGVVYSASVPQALRDPIVLDPVAPPLYEPRSLPPVSEPSSRANWTTPAAPKKSDGFCSSKKCRWTLAVVGASAAGYAAWRLWPCPPGTVRR